MSSPAFRVLERYPRLTILHHREADGTLWGTSGRAVLARRDGRWQTIARLPFAMPRDLFSFARPLARAARSDKCNVIVNSAGLALAIRAGQVYALRGSRPKPLFTIQGDSVLHRGLCEDEQGWVYFGEYFMNPGRGPVRIWRVAADGNHWETAYEFPAGSIRHVHGVFRDPYDPAALWAAVGDLGGECYLFRTRDRFQTVERFGDGSQTWRAVSLFFTPGHICWLTDSNLDQNHACRMDRDTGALETGQEIDNSGWYGAATEEGLYVAFTTVERGPAIHRRESSVLVSRDAFHWEEVFSFKKDFWRPVQVFKYGVISCPSGSLSQSDFYISGEGLVGLDGCSLRVALDFPGRSS